MASLYLIIVSAIIFIFLLGIAFGHSILILKLRKEENRKRELEVTILEKRSQILKESKIFTDNLEEIIFKANVQKEIDNILRKQERD